MPASCARDSNCESVYRKKEYVTICNHVDGTQPHDLILFFSHSTFQAISNLSVRWNRRAQDAAELLASVAELHSGVLPADWPLAVDLSRSVLSDVTTCLFYLVGR
jgi:hypothetical protein